MDVKKLNLMQKISLRYYRHHYNRSVLLVVQAWMTWKSIEKINSRCPNENRRFQNIISSCCHKAITRFSLILGCDVRVCAHGVFAHLPLFRRIRIPRHSPTPHTRWFKLHQPHNTFHVKICYCYFLLIFNAHFSIYFISFGCSLMIFRLGHYCYSKFFLGTFLNLI